jgi:hypothetical protein
VFLHFARLEPNHQTAAMKQSWDEGHIEIIINRENSLEDSVLGLHNVPVVSLNQVS